MRTALPDTPKVGTSRLKSSTSGRRVRLPTGTAKIGTPRMRRRAAACTGGGPSFQSPSEASTMPRRFAIFSGARASGSFRSVPWPALGSAMGWRTMFIRSRSLFHDDGSVNERDGLAPAGRLRCRLAGGDDVAGVHAGRRVPEHGDRRLFLGAELLDPFGLIEQHSDRADQPQPQELEQPHRRPITATAPGDKAEARRDQHGQERRPRPTTASPEM